MLLAELEVRHSRPFAPTRRVALGDMYLPNGFGGLLLAGIVGAGSARILDEDRDRVDVLLSQVERGQRIIQPRLRHRFQKDTHGLDRSRHKLQGDGEHVEIDIDDHGPPMPQILAAIYAAGMFERQVRPAAFRLIRRATRWQGEADERLVSFLTTDRAHGSLDEGWALALLGFVGSREPTRGEINRRFRTLVRDAHPDHGAPVEEAGRRIQDLTEAKRILLSAR